jgi:hypothetical protein
MNAIVPTAPPQSSGFALVPRDMREAMDLAAMMAKGKLVPAALQQSPADCLLVIEQATRWGMSPFAVAQEVSVIQGKLMHSGKIVAAAVHGSGVLEGRLSYAYSGEGAGRSVTVRGRLRGETEPVEVTVKLSDAKTSNQWWTKSPDQMLSYHGARVWARRFVPEVMLGVYSPEEFDEPSSTTAEPRQVPNLAQPTQQPKAEPGPMGLLLIAPLTGKVHEVADEKWLQGISRALGQLESAQALRIWRDAMRGHLKEAHEADQDMAMEALRMIDEREADLTGTGDETELAELAETEA